MTTALQEAITAHQSGNLAEAEKLYRDVLAAEPKLFDARYNLGMIYGKQGRSVDAARELALAVETRPDSGDAWFMLSEFAGYAGQFELSRFAGEQAVTLMPAFARAWLRYGISLAKLERNEDAIAAYRKSLAIDPSQIAAWINLGVTLKGAGKPHETLKALHKAFEAAGFEIPDETQREVGDDAYGLLDFHLALVELLLGDYRQGFARFRARFRGGTNWKRIATPKPVWRGENLTGKTILVTTEVGYGDALMMCRYLPLLKNKGARVLFRSPPALAPLLTGWNGVDGICLADEALPADFDCHAAIFDLPHRFGTTLDNLPGHVPYLPLPSPDAKTELTVDGRPRAGVVWAGEPAHQNDKRRSLPLQLFAQIFAETGWQFFSLTRDMRPGDREILARYPVTDLAPMIGDFADSAKLVNQLDLVITCDSALAHLAGGMGKQVLTLLPFAPDWRWLCDREDSPWYPTMRLLRQSRKDDWSDVIAGVKEVLQKEDARGLKTV